MGGEEDDDRCLENRNTFWRLRWLWAIRRRRVGLRRLRFLVAGDLVVITVGCCCNSSEIFTVFSAFFGKRTPSDVSERGKLKAGTEQDELGQLVAACRAPCRTDPPPAFFKYRTHETRHLMTPYPAPCRTFPVSCSVPYWSSPYLPYSMPYSPRTVHRAVLFPYRTACRTFPVPYCVPCWPQVPYHCAVNMTQLYRVWYGTTSHL